MKTLFLFLRIALIVGLLGAFPSAFAQDSAAGKPPADPWPRVVNLADGQVLVYQPQVNRWTDNQLDFRAALAIKPDNAKQETFGVIFASARTQVDKVMRTVVFENLRISKIDFPTLPDHGAAYAAELQTAVRHDHSHHVARPSRVLARARRHQAAHRGRAEQPAVGDRQLFAGDSGADRRRTGAQVRAG